MIPIQRSNIWLKANEKRVIPIYLLLPFGSNRIERIINKVKELTEEELNQIVEQAINKA